MGSRISGQKTKDPLAVRAVGLEQILRSRSTPTPDSNSCARCAGKHRRHCLDRRRHMERSIYPNQSCNPNRFFDRMNRKSCSQIGRKRSLLRAPSRLRNLQNFHLPNRNSELYFCPLIAVPKIYTAMGVCGPRKPPGKFHCNFGRHKTVCRRGRVFTIRRTSTTPAEWVLLPAFGASKAIRSLSRESRSS